MITKIKAFSTFNRLVLLSQSLFGLPWVVAGALLPGRGYSVSASCAIWLVIAFMSARLSGMGFNRIIDQYIDAKNPRTASRPLPMGEISRKTVLLFSLFCLFIFFMATYQVNTIAFALSPIIALLLVGYSFTKRCTWGCHLVLGAVQFFGPFLAWTAVTGSLSHIAVFLGASLGCCISANDILYAFQDIEFDRKERLYSIPAIFGEKKALFIARTLHLLSVLFLFAVGIFSHSTVIYFAGSILIGRIFYMTYNQKVPIGAQFALSNTYAGLTLLLSIVLERIWRVLW